MGRDSQSERKGIKRRRSDKKQPSRHATPMSIGSDTLHQGRVLRSMRTKTMGLQHNTACPKHSRAHTCADNQDLKCIEKTTTK